MKISQNDVTEYSFDTKEDMLVAKTRSGEELRISKRTLKYMSTLLSNPTFVSGKTTMNFGKLGSGGCGTC